MINLSKRWWYAIRAVMYVAKEDKLLKVSDIWIAQKIPESLLRRLIARLEKVWILKTVKWRNGGVVLWKELKEISVYDILFSVWEKLSIRSCSVWVECDNSDLCVSSNLMNNLQKWFNTLLKINTLDKLLNK